VTCKLLINQNQRILRDSFFDLFCIFTHDESGQTLLFPLEDFAFPMEGLELLISLKKNQNIPLCPPAKQEE